MDIFKLTDRETYDLIKSIGETSRFVTYSRSQCIQFILDLAEDKDISVGVHELCILPTEFLRALCDIVTRED